MRQCTLATGTRGCCFQQQSRASHVLAQGTSLKQQVADGARVQNAASLKPIKRLSQITRAQQMPDRKAGVPS